jgi:uncharacterized protein
MRIPVLVLVAAALVGCATSADQLEKAEAAYKRRDYATAAALWRPLANEGNAPAQTGMGILYENGLEVPRDRTQSINWYRKAAGQGDAEAEYRLGEAYVLGSLSGAGLSRDIGLGLELMKKAASQGNIQSMNSIGSLYQHGLFGIVKDSNEAYIWYRKAADLGDPIAESRVGSAYEFGQGVEKDSEQAKIWYARSAAEDRKRADNGDVVSQLSLGLSYELGVGGFPRDPAEALTWYRKAAQQDGPLKKEAEDDVTRVEHQIAP